MERLQHVAIVVSDIGEALAWYGSRFVVEIAYADDSWALLQFENIALAFVLPGQHPPHITVEREDAESFGPLTPHRGGTTSVYIADPWGNAIEFMKPERRD